MRAALLAFYEREARALPWRRTRDPYAIWVSEIMLQQTQVQTVIPRYQAFLREFPTVEALAAASETRVCEAWAGLGYYRRARNLHAAARQVVSEHGGRIPETAAQLQTLPGIGRYTAGAIASIAHDEAAPVLDGNVIRVLTRVFALAGDPQRGQVRNRLWHLAQQLVAGERPGELNQALMELGATVCTPRAPRCECCPASSMCRAKASGEPTAYPQLPAKSARKALPMAMLWLADAHGVWFSRRPLDGLWAGLWEPPSASGRGAKTALAQRFGVRLGAPLATVTHLLTHRRVEARIYRPTSLPALQDSEALQCFPEPRNAPISALARKVIDVMLN